jgi:hypothetical protein
VTDYILDLADCPCACASVMNQQLSMSAIPHWVNHLVEVPQFVAFCLDDDLGPQKAIGHC